MIVIYFQLDIFQKQICLYNGRYNIIYTFFFKGPTNVQGPVGVRGPDGDRGYKGERGQPGYLVCNFTL